MALTEETDLRQFAWVTAPGWAKQSRQRWSPDQVNRIALVYVNNRQKDSTYTYEKACKTCGYLYNHINGIWQKGKTKDDKKSNKVYSRLKGAVKRLTGARRRQDAENAIRRVQQQNRSHESSLTPSTRVLGPLQPVNKSCLDELLENYTNIKQRYTHTVQSGSHVLM